MSWTFTLDVEPTAKGRPKFGRGFAYTPAKTKRAEAEIRRMLASKMNRPPVVEPIKCEITFFLRKPIKPRFKIHPAVRPDLDNFAKLILDAANNLLWLDDGLICELNLKKQYSDNPRIELFFNVLD